MASYQTTIRDAAYNKIVASKLSLPITVFEVSKTYVPNYWLEELGTQPGVSVAPAGMGADRNRQLRDTSVKYLDLAVIVHVLQQMGNNQNTTSIDLLMEHMEGIMDILEVDDLVANVNWSNTEPLKDDSGMIYDYEALQESGIFWAVFIVHYTYIRQ